LGDESFSKPTAAIRQHYSLFGQIDSGKHYGSAIFALSKLFYMKPVPETLPGRNNPDLRSFMLITLFAGVPVYWACLFYIEAVTRQEIEELAIAATVCFFGFFYIGMSLARAWAVNKSHVSQRTMFGLATAIFILTVWLFLHADYQMRSLPAMNLLLFWLPFILLSMLLAILVNLGRISVQYQIQKANVSTEQMKGELQLLQSQLSPHFLFNTLNNLYGLSITQHEKVPPLLLKLSDLLRYSVYDVREMYVPLNSELEYVNNYIAFEKIRIGDRLHLTTSFQPINSEAIKIAPMLLITFIENAFKHAKNTADSAVYIDIDLKTWGDRILFSVKNSYTSGNDLSGLNKNSGLGLTNAKKRLELLYPNEHELNLAAEGDVYTVMLQLKIKQDESIQLPDR
jgi:hypothetical protein